MGWIVTIAQIVPADFVNFLLRKNEKPMQKGLISGKEYGTIMSLDVR